MRILVLGGTIFYGRHFTEAALHRGHQVTLFTRGLHNDDLFEAADRRHGDRDGGLASLQDGTWDAVLDTCGYVPRVVRASAELLRERTRLYGFVSSISVFSGEGKLPLTEGSPRIVLEDPETEVVDGATYGGLKALCEDVVRETFAERALIIRPGLIVGPYDTSDRFSYWPWRLRKGGETIIPDRPDQAVQIIDARDLATWTLDALESGVTGTFNGTGPAEPYRLGSLLDRIQAAVGGQAQLTRVPPKFLEEMGVQFWTELPLSHGDGSDALMQVDVSKAVGAGLRFRSLEETTADTLQFVLGRGENHPWRNGLPSEKEARVLAAWHSRNG